MTETKAPSATSVRLLHIQEAAAEVGLTARSVRYYEEVGLLRPAGRSDYRLFDESDLERLRFIKGLRDDAGFSLAEIAELLEDEAARERDRAAFRATADPAERKRILRARVSSFDTSDRDVAAKDRPIAVDGGRDRRPARPERRPPWEALGEQGSGAPGPTGGPE